MIHSPTNALREKRAVVSPTLSPMATFPSYDSDAGCTKLDVTPGGGFEAGVKVGVGVALDILLEWWTYSYYEPGEIDMRRGKGERKKYGLGLLIQIVKCGIFCCIG